MKRNRASAAGIACITAVDIMPKYTEPRAEKWE